MTAAGRSTWWRRPVRWLAFALAIALPPLVVAGLGLRTLKARQRPAALPTLPAQTQLPAAPAHDPSKPTVAVLLGADMTEVTDALGPYEMFARAGVFNVYVVAPERQPTMLSGGLRILPHLSLSELDARLAARPPAIVVVPMIPNIAGARNRPLVDWIQRQAAAGALMHSWCTGAMALAEAGLLDGLTATAHWGDLDGLARRFPRVKWVRGMRWVDHGKVITSGGLTSGIDASLRVLTRVAGEDVARRVARELRYPNHHFANAPAVTPYSVRPADTILLANAAFRLSRQQIGLALYDGVGELDLSNLYDTHSYSAVADVHAVSATGGFIRTAHGLTVLPALAATSKDGTAVIAIRDLDRFVVPGRDHAGAGAVVSAMRSVVPALAPTFVHAEAGERFGLELVIEDLARTADVPTARFALKRLEYRSDSVHLAGAAVPWEILPVPVMASVLGLLLAIPLAQFLRNRAAGRPSSPSPVDERLPSRSAGPQPSAHEGSNVRARQETRRREPHRTLPRRRPGFG